MSWEHYPAVWEAGRARNLKPSTRHVLLALAERANDAGICWPSQATLANDTGLSQATVKRALKELRRERLIARRRRANTRGHRTSDLIRLEGTVTPPKGHHDLGTSKRTSNESSPIRGELPSSKGVSALKAATPSSPVTDRTSKKKALEVTVPPRDRDAENARAREEYLATRHQYEGYDSDYEERAGR